MRMSTVLNCAACRGSRDTTAFRMAYWCHANRNAGVRCHSSIPQKASEAGQLGSAMAQWGGPEPNVFIVVACSKRVQHFDAEILEAAQQKADTCSRRCCRHGHGHFQASGQFLAARLTWD